MEGKLKSGNEILNEFFNGIEQIENVDPKIAKMIARLYKDDILTEKSVRNELEKFRNFGEDEN